MKLKTRLIIAFITVTILPLLLSVAVIFTFSQLQLRTIEKNYGITGATYESFSNPVRMLSKVTESSYQQLTITANRQVEKFADITYLDSVNQELRTMNSYLILREEQEVVYSGSDSDTAAKVYEQLPEYGHHDSSSENGVYVGGSLQVLIKQIDFVTSEGLKGSAFIITDVSQAIPEVSQFVTDMLVAIVVILALTAALLIIWIYRGVAIPLGRMKIATQNIKEGNLDFELEVETDDEIGQLCRDFEEMRMRLRDTTSEKIEYDKRSKELISNISHDLKTPITAIKGYVEGIMDGVADTPEKMDRYIKTIYNKANEMDLLINELTLYSKIDSNRIPYNFNTISVSDYFDDCAVDLQMDLESRGVDFSYVNYVEGDVKIIADAEQLKRVINNIVSNSAKYMDKPKGQVNLRVKDVGDFIQVEIEDNGKGIGAKELPYIFERFYRTDASRNSSTGGSGIGLSIVKKIVEEHGGKIWATSKEGTGTVMYFVIRKYQEVPVNE
ncbi:MAG: HAMP domain-containing histidine kinase [Tyzzerella sp.]|nr:HAMP domain-containing histidine kinase [Tyzzerella sp.]